MEVNYNPDNLINEVQNILVQAMLPPNVDKEWFMRLMRAFNNEGVPTQVVMKVFSQVGTAEEKQEDDE